MAGAIIEARPWQQRRRPPFHHQTMSLAHCQCMLVLVAAQRLQAAATHCVGTPSPYSFQNMHIRQCCGHRFPHLSTQRARAQYRKPRQRRSTQCLPVVRTVTKSNAAANDCVVRCIAPAEHTRVEQSADFTTEVSASEPHPSKQTQFPAAYGVTRHSENYMPHALCQLERARARCQRTLANKLL
jgi:hypothetical protein